MYSATKNSPSFLDSLVARHLKENGVEPARQTELNLPAYRQPSVDSAMFSPIGPQRLLRNDGVTYKDEGYFGQIPMTDGSGRNMTEMSVSYEGGQDIPAIVPTLDRSQLDQLAAGRGVTPDIGAKARAFAEWRASQGKSPFADSSEARPWGPVNQIQEDMRSLERPPVMYADNSRTVLGPRLVDARNNWNFRNDASLNPEQKADAEHFHTTHEGGNEYKGAPDQNSIVEKSLNKASGIPESFKAGEASAKPVEDVNKWNEKDHEMMKQYPKEWEKFSKDTGTNPFLYKGRPALWRLHMEEHLKKQAQKKD
jgi:hypothetical protein